MPQIDLISLRQGFESDWTATNPVLAPGEAGSEIDTGRLKVGNGTNPWVELPYTSPGDDGIHIGPTPPKNKNILWADTMTQGSTSVGPPGAPGQPGIYISTEAQALEGVDNTTAMSPLRVRQAIPFIDLCNYGAKYDGSDDSAAFQAAIDAAPAYGHIHISGPLALGSKVTCQKTITLTGEGFASPISPLPTFPPGQFMLEFSWAQTSPGGRASHLADLKLDNLMFDGKLRSIAANGIRVMQTQESMFSRLNFLNMRGTGMQLYRSVRDSMFNFIILRACGDFDADLPAFDIYEDSGGTQDSHNNLWFTNMSSHINGGDALRIECGRDSNMRVFSFVNFKMHGVWGPGTINSDVPLGHYNTNRVVVRNATGVMFTNCRFHETAPGLPLMHIGGHPNVPGSASRVGVDLSNVSFGNQDVVITTAVTGAASNTLTVDAAPHYLATGAMVKATSSTVAGIALNTDYFVIRVDPTSIRLGTTYNNAKAATAMTTGATGAATLVTQNIRVFIDEGTYGDVRENPGVNMDGPANRCAWVSKSHLQVLRQYGSTASMLDPAYYEGVIDEAEKEPHGHIEIDGVLDHDGTKVGFYDKTPVVRPAVAVAATDAATTQALANAIRTALINLGLVV